MRRGEVWWAQLAQPIGRRPVLLLSRDSAYRGRASITVAPVIRTIRHIPAEVDLGLQDGMPETCVVNLDDIATVRKGKLTSRITELSPEKMGAVARAICFALDLKIE